MRNIPHALALIAAFVTSCRAVHTESVAYSLHERRTVQPQQWRRGSRVARDAVLPIRIGLAQSNLDDADGHLMEVSHPDSPNYGKHWTVEQVHDMFAPAEEAIRQVSEWLQSAGIEDVVHSDNKGWLAFDIPAWQAEDLFKTDFYEYEHRKSAETGRVKVGCDEYHLPSHLVSHIDYITPGVALSPGLIKKSVKRDFHRGWVSKGQGGKPGSRPPARWTPPRISHNYFPPAASKQLPSELQDCGRNITPCCIRALYNIPKAFRRDNVNMLGLFEAGDKYAQSDLDAFYKLYAPNVPQGTHPTLNSIDGGRAPVPADSPDNTGESDLDIDLAYALIYPQTVVLYQVDDIIYDQIDGQFNTFLDALDGSYCTYSAYGITGNSPDIDPTYPDPLPGGYKGKLMCGVYKPTRVISVSYGVSEYDAPLNYTKRQCNEFLKLGLQGVTIMYASGDYGVASFPGDNSESGCLGDQETIYNPSFPTCPYVTSVGATRLYDSQTILDAESALQAELTDAPNFASAGGFSNYFSVPSYQKTAVSQYFARHDPGLPYYVAKYNSTDITNLGERGGVYNRAGRGLPDVAANGANLRAFTNGTNFHYFGTSLAAPIWGSIMTLVNEERTAIGKGSVGFINPVLYSNTWVFKDIVNGSNPGCGSAGFSAVPGWDPVTGLGTPNYPRLLTLFLSLP